MRLTVDGEVFEVQERTDDPGVYDFEWESNPVARYGFSMARNDRAKIPEGALTEAIREFLASVPSQTGHIKQ